MQREGYTQALLTGERERESGLTHTHSIDLIRPIGS